MTRTALTTSEAQEREVLEACIRTHMASFIEVGRALTAIRDKRLYRSTHGTFEDYCRERWDMGKPYATQLICAANTVESLRDGCNCNQIPKNESQVRPLTKLKDPSEQQEAWARACEVARKEKRNVIAVDVQRAVRDMTTPSGSEPTKVATRTRQPRSTMPTRLRHAIGVLRQEIEIIQERNWRGVNRDDTRKCVMNIIKLIDTE